MLVAMNTTELQGTFREMWVTRPTRPQQGRQLAGVAAALARRYDIDPVLVRVALVVSAFYGVGAALYLAGWVLLPAEPVPDGEPPPRRPRVWVLAGFGVAVVATLGALHDGHLLPGAAIAAALLFLLHRTRGGRAVAAAPVAPPVDEPAGERTTPPAWDPLGAAPFAWDLPEPGPAAPPAPPRPRSRVTPVTLAAALLAGGITALVLLLGPGFDAPVLLGVVLAVLGGGLLVGAFTRGGRGLVPVALLAVAVTAGHLAFAPRWAEEGVGDLTAAPVDAAAVAPRYETGLGDVALDLRGVDLTGSTVPLRTEVQTGAGDVRIAVPADADLRFSGSAGAGDITVDGREHDGPGVELRVDDLGRDGVAGGRPLVVEVHAGLGDVEVSRG
jgi:phage shock protein PspC (stress-responsive transcriptional regulator)